MTTNDFYLISFAFAMILAVISLSQSHIANVVRREAGWGYSAVLLVSLVSMFILGFIAEGKPLSPEGRITLFNWSYLNIFVPLSATMFALLGFFVASAAFRAFRIRTLESSLLLISALIVLFGRVPLGEYLWGQIMPKGVPPISRIIEWIMSGPQMAATRGILIGVSLGVVAMSLKVILGIERAYLGTRE